MTLPSSSPQAAADDSAPRWHFANVVLDEATLELSVDGRKVEVARKPLELLMHFVRNPDEVITKDELFEAVWPGRIVSETSLTNAIGRLRVALGDEAQALIKSVYGYGYRFTGDPQRAMTPGTPTPSPPMLSFADGDPVPGRDGWRLRRRLGAGGSGEAWLAQHAESRDTRVFKFARDRGALVALKREITLSRLMREGLGERPDFVRILDWSLDEPPFFIAIEYCNEGSVVDWSERQGGIRLVPLAQRLELLAKAADALAGAHQVGVLHKDLKPSNLLLHKDSEGQLLLKLADFGAARLIDRDRLLSLDITRLGFTQTIAEPSSGTPLYLAPELLTGSPPTTRSDIYALGAMLYQLAVGDLRRSLAPGWERDVDDPLLREDIALCADGNPQRRLADATELSTRLRSLPDRHAAAVARAAEEQEAARLRQRLLGAEQRRRSLRTLAAVLALGLAAAAVGFWQARSAQAHAERALAEADAVSAFLRDDVLTAADPYRSGGANPTVRELLDRAARSIDRRFTEQPQVRAAIGFALARSYEGLGDWAQAEVRAEAAWKDVAADASPISPLARDILNLRALLALAPSRMDDATRLYTQLRDERRRSLGAAHPDTLRAEGRLAWITFRQGHYDDALKLYQSIRERATEARPADALLVPELDLDIASVEQELNQDDAAAERVRAALPLYAKAAPGDPETTRLWRQNALASILLKAGRPAEAEPLLIESLAGLRSRLGPEHPYVAVVLGDIGWLRMSQSRPAEAIAPLRESLALTVKAEGSEHPWSRLARNQLANALLDGGDKAAALAESQLAYEGCRRDQGAEHPHCLSFAATRALTLAANGQRAAAKQLLRDNLDIARRVFPGSNWRTGNMLHAMATIVSDDGDPVATDAAWQQAADMLRKQYKPNHQDWLKFVADANKAGVTIAAGR